MYDSVFGKLSSGVWGGKLWSTGFLTWWGSGEVGK